MSRKHILIFAIFASAAAGIASFPAAAPASVDEPAASISRGRTAAASRCERCHAIEHRDKSARPAAPPFKVIATRYAADGLQLELQNIAEIGHHEMQPTFVELSVRKDLVAYIESLRP